MDGYILVVEDDDATASLVGDLLQEELSDTAVATARTAQEAMAVTRRGSPDLAVIDLMLPLECGIELAGVLRDNGCASTPLLAMTASTFLAEVARESGLFRGVLEKPFDLDELLLTVSELTLPERDRDGIEGEDARPVQPAESNGLQGAALGTGPAESVRGRGGGASWGPARRPGIRASLPSDKIVLQYSCQKSPMGNNSCAVHSVMGGKTVDNTEELDILTYDGVRMRVGRTPDGELERIIAEGGRRGEIYRRLRALRHRYADLIRERYPDIPRRVSGYNLDQLLPENGFNVARALVGSESTCVTILEAGLRLLHSPPHRAILVIGYPDLFRAGDNAGPLREFGPIAIEAFEAHVIDNMRRKGKRVPGADLLPEGSTWLIVEYGGETVTEARDRAEEARQGIETRLQGHTAIQVI